MKRVYLSQAAYDQLLKRMLTVPREPTDPPAEYELHVSNLFPYEWTDEETGEIKTTYGMMCDTPELELKLTDPVIYRMWPYVYGATGQ